MLGDSRRQRRHGFAIGRSSPTRPRRRARCGGVANGAAVAGDACSERVAGKPERDGHSAEPLLVAPRGALGSLVVACGGDKIFRAGSRAARCLCDRVFTRTQGRGAGEVVSPFKAPSYEEPFLLRAASPRRERGVAGAWGVRRDKPAWRCR